jgi:hypothetical protein
MMSVEQLVEWDLAGETVLHGKTCPGTTLSTTNPTRPDLGSNPGRRGGKPATNRLRLWHARASGLLTSLWRWLQLTVFSSPIIRSNTNMFRMSKFFRTPKFQQCDTARSMQCARPWNSPVFRHVLKRGNGGSLALWPVICLQKGTVSYRAGSTGASPTHDPAQYLSHPWRMFPMLPTVNSTTSWSPTWSRHATQPILNSSLQIATELHRRRRRQSELVHVSLQDATKCIILSLLVFYVSSQHKTWFLNTQQTLISNWICFSYHRRAKRSATTPQYSSQTQEMVVTCGEVIVRRIKHAQEYRTTK